MSLEKRTSFEVSIQRTDACQTHCNAMGGSESSFNTAHGQQEYLARKAKNGPSQPC